MYRNRWPKTFRHRIAITLSLGILTESSTLNSTTPRPFSILVPATDPTSTPASLTASPLKTPAASRNCASSAYWWGPNTVSGPIFSELRFPIFTASASVSTAETAAKASTFTRVAFENRRTATSAPFRRSLAHRGGDCTWSARQEERRVPWRYASDEQRSDPGCRRSRMPRDFRNGALEPSVAQRGVLAPFRRERAADVLAILLGARAPDEVGERRLG